MAVEHVDITDPEIHEPKGASTATANQVYVADGAASGTWQKIKNVNLHGVSATPGANAIPRTDGSGGFTFKQVPHGAFYYTAIGSGTTYTAPTSYTKIGPTTTGDADPQLVTHSGTGRLTYTGTDTVDVDISATICFKHSAGAGVDCYFQVHKDGSPLTGAEFPQVADSTGYQTVSIHAHTSVATNSYLEVWCKCSSGNIVVHALNVLLRG